MLSAEECIAKAAELRLLAEAKGPVSADLLVMAEIWLDVSITAEWQDKWAARQT